MKSSRVPCPACGAPLEIPEQAAYITCHYCRAQSRIDRSAKPRPAQPGELVIHLAKTGLNGVLAAFTLFGAMVLMLFAGLGAAYIASSYRGKPANLEMQVELLTLSTKLDNHEFLLETINQRTIVASRSGVLLTLNAQGEVAQTLALPIPTPGARLTGLAEGPNHQLYASLGGQLYRITASGEVAQLTLKPSQPVRSIAGTPNLELYAILETNELTQLSPEGQTLKTWPLPQELNSEGTRVALSGHGEAAFYKLFSTEIYLLNISSGNIKKLTLPKNEAARSNIAFTPEGELWLQSSFSQLRIQGGGLPEAGSLSVENRSLQLIHFNSRGQLTALDDQTRLMRLK